MSTLAFSLRTATELDLETLCFINFCHFDTKNSTKNTKLDITKNHINNEGQVNNKDLVILKYGKEEENISNTCINLVPRRVSSLY